MQGTFKIFTLFGIDVHVHWTWLFIFALLTWSLATGYLPAVAETWTPQQRWIVAALTSILFFASVLAHEFSHSIVARARALPVHSITLFMFGGVSALGGEPRTARDEFWIAIVGPLTSFAAAVVFGIIWFVAGNAGLSGVETVAEYLTIINISVGIFNLLPGFRKLKLFQEFVGRH
jgi:Zn-dependent protease